LTPLQTRVARDIITMVRRDNRPAGHHLAKLALAREVGTSHNPVEAALAHLARIGVARHDSDRGYFLARDARELGAVAQKLSVTNGERLYHRIASARLSHQLPDTATEIELQRRFGTTRAEIRRVLTRSLFEGWAERRPGHGWNFLPLIDSAAAYEDSYEIRKALEPAGLLGNKFEMVPEELLKLRQEQDFMANGGYEQMTAREWIDLNARFHETLARWSGNALLLQTIRRMNQLRRLVEYRAVTHNPALRSRQATEHLRILAAIERGDRDRAAALLRSHLDSARRDKVKPTFSRKAGKK
jgi:DNA-binding GntR family transcriptional regulator